MIVLWLALGIYALLLLVVVVGIVLERIDAWRHGYISLGDRR